MNNFWKSSLGFSFFTFVSRVFGYLRDLTLAAFLGAGQIYDIFVVIFRIPNVFRSFFGEGAMAQSLVPSIIEARENINVFLNQIFSLLFFSLIIFVGLAELFPDLFVTIFAPGFIQDADKFNQASYFLQIVFPYILLISMTAYFGAIQNSKKVFQFVAATPIFFNLSLICFALSFSELSLSVLGISILTAGIIQLILNFSVVVYLGVLPKLTIYFDRDTLKSFFNKFVPAIFAAGVYQLNVLVDTIFASFLITGSPTWLYLSERLVQFPLGLFGVAVALVSLPNLTELFLKNDMKQISSQSFKILGILILMGIICFFGAFFLGDLIIELLFKRGEFSNYDVNMTFLALQGYAISLIFLLPQKYFNSLFFAISKTYMVVTTGLIALITNLILNYYFIFELDFGHYGLALATSVSSVIVFFIILTWLFNKKVLIVN